MLVIIQSMYTVSAHTAFTLSTSEETTNLSGNPLRCGLDVIHITVNILAYVLLGITWKMVSQVCRST